MASLSVENEDWLATVFGIEEEDTGALSPFDMSDIFSHNTIPVGGEHNTTIINIIQQTNTADDDVLLLDNNKKNKKNKKGDNDDLGDDDLQIQTTTSGERPTKKVKKSVLKKSVREKARRDALNDRFLDLSRSLQEPIVSEDELKTDKSSIVIAARECILALRAKIEKLNECLAAERSEWAKTKEELINEKIMVEQKLQNFMSKMPFASAIPNTGSNKLINNNNNAILCMGGEEDIEAPILIVSTTTAEEDAKWRAPLA